MLVISRKPEESFLIGHDIRIKVLDIRHGNKVRIGIDAPDESPIHRAEVYAEIMRQASEIVALKHEDITGADVLRLSKREPTWLARLHSAMDEIVGFQRVKPATKEEKAKSAIIKHLGTTWNEEQVGVITCPVCGVTESLQYLAHCNGPIHARCKTSGCVSLE